jgi:hypothetical protein
MERVRTKYKEASENLNELKGLSLKQTEVANGGDHWHNLLIFRALQKLYSMYCTHTEHT